MQEPLRVSVQKITKLPTLPLIARKLIDLADDDQTSVGILAELIENDPPIAAKLLSVSNSAFFISDLPSTTIGNAIIRIGFENVKNIALGISLFTLFGGGQQDRPMSMKRLFQHSVAVGLFGKKLSEDMKLNSPDETFVCGLFHDLGMLVLNNYFGEAYGKVMDVFLREKSLLDAEIEVMGLDHATVGAWLADKWNLPDAAVSSICRHHFPGHACNVITASIHLSDYIISRDFFSVTEKDPGYPFDPSALDCLGMSEQSLTTFSASIDRDIFSGEVFAL